MQIGIDSFVATLPDPTTGISLTPAERIQNLLEEIEHADRVGVEVFGVGEHHRRDFADSAPAVILAAAAARTRQIRLTSAVTVLSASDPVRAFQEFATVDLISQGRAEMVVGRGSFGEAFPLFGFSFDDYDSLFSEKLDLLLKIRDQEKVVWSGKLTGQPTMVALFEQIGMGQWLRYATGLIEVSAAVLLLVPHLRVFGAALATATMFGALVTHALIGGSAIPAAVLFSVAAFVLWVRKGELTALNKPAKT